MNRISIKKQQISKYSNKKLDDGYSLRDHEYAAIAGQKWSSNSINIKKLSGTKLTTFEKTHDALRLVWDNTLSVFNNKEATARKFLRKVVDIKATEKNDTKNKNKRISSSKIVELGSMSHISDVFLRRNGDIDCDCDGKNAFHSGAQRPEPQIAEILINSLDTSSIFHKYNDKNALEMCAENGNNEIMKTYLAGLANDGNSLSHENCKKIVELSLKNSNDASINEMKKFYGKPLIVSIIKELSAENKKSNSSLIQNKANKKDSVREFC